MADTETDCRAVLERLYLFLDGEIAGDVCSEIERHLSQCRDCFGRVSFERELKELIGRTCREDRVPEELVARLRARLREIIG